jgi:predicted unusual protein kinase regulating ubiquinone biosynthesis (AarF/ABC1/UbiB family)
MAAARALARGDASVESILADERLASAAENAARTMGQMKGAVMKIGQLVSFVDSDLVPPAYREALAILQADAPPMPYALVEDVVRAELGAAPREIFSFFSEIPIAAASIGQVHAARLAGPAGERELVVKVQYPGVAEAIEADLANGALLSLMASLLQRILGPWAPGADVRAIVEEVRDRVGEELDYRIEAANQQEFADLYREDVVIGVPEVVHELSTAKVLTMEYVDAMRWAAAIEQPKVLRDQWGRTIARFVWGSLYGHRLFNADPHPGNYLFHEDGTVTFLDFGCVKRFTAERVASLRELMLAARDDDPDRMLAAFVGTGMLRTTEGFDKTIAVEWIRRAYEPLHSPQPYTYTKEWAAAALSDVMSLKLGPKERKLINKVDLPPDQVFLLRITAGLDSVLAGLNATFDCHEVARDVGMW